MPSKPVPAFTAAKRLIAREDLKIARVDPTGAGAYLGSDKIVIPHGASNPIQHLWKQVAARDVHKSTRGLRADGLAARASGQVARSAVADLRIDQIINARALVRQKNAGTPQSPYRAAHQRDYDAVRTRANAAVAREGLKVSPEIDALLWKKQFSEGESYAMRKLRRLSARLDAVLAVCFGEPARNNDGQFSKVAVASASQLRTAYGQYSGKQVLRRAVADVVRSKRAGAGASAQIPRTFARRDVRLQILAAKIRNSKK